MKKSNISITLLSLIFLPFFHLHSFNSNPPKLTIMIVIDQFSYNYINKLNRHLRHGLRYLLDNGVVYTNAFMPHGRPGTAPGHAALNTGTYAKNHGFIDNNWYQETGEKIACDDDPSPDSLVISPTGTYDFGKSAHMLMTDGISDQCVLASNPQSPFNAYSISLKSRAAIATASKLGKALWFDHHTGNVTSSKAYFKDGKLPEWVHNFNQIHNPKKQETITWHRMYPYSPTAYNFFNTLDYRYALIKDSFINRPLMTFDTEHMKNPFHIFEKTPHANKWILDLAQKCIETHVSKKTKDRLLLWVCLSPLDKVAHRFGPQSLESIDMIYHLDKQLQKFMQKIMKLVGKHQVLITLTADHGVMPFPELVHETGLTNAQRIDENEFINYINNYLTEKYNISNLIHACEGQELTLNREIMAQYTLKKQRALIEDLKYQILNHPGIKHVWDSHELSRTCTQPNTIEDNIKNQVFEGRSGQIIVQPYPYNLITRWDGGTSHKTPYSYDTHIPLIIFHPGKFERKYVRQRVSALQLANTVAEILNVAKPSSSTAEILPELFDVEYE